MRKYFLLSLVCIFSSYQANADNSLAAGMFQARVSVEKADEITCEGALTATIIVNNTSRTVELVVMPNAQNVSISMSDIVASDVLPAECTISNSTFTDIANFTLPEMVNLNDAGTIDGLKYQVTQSTVGNFQLVISPDGKSVSICGTFTIYLDDALDAQTLATSIPIAYTYE